MKVTIYDTTPTVQFSPATCWHRRGTSNIERSPWKCSACRRLSCCKNTSGSIISTFDSKSGTTKTGMPNIFACSTRAFAKSYCWIIVYLRAPNPWPGRLPPTLPTRCCCKPTIDGSTGRLATSRCHLPAAITRSTLARGGRSDRLPLLLEFRVEDESFQFLVDAEH